jgi:hypothetical protein
MRFTQSSTDKSEALDQSLVSDDVATDHIPYQVEEDARLSQGRGRRFSAYSVPCLGFCPYLQRFLLHLPTG